MATTMKKTTKTIEEPVLTEEIVSETVVEKPVVKKKKFAADEAIPCVSIVSGQLGMIGIKSRINYSWMSRGDETKVEYQDLVAAIRSGKSQIFKPSFIITDDDFLKEFPQVEKIYNAMFSYRDLKEVLDLPPAQMKQAILALPAGARESIKHIAATAISNGSLDSVARIKVLDEIFDTKLMLMTELFG